MTGAATVAGVEITHPNRPLFGGSGLTKRDLAEYYAGIAVYEGPPVP